MSSVLQVQKKTNFRSSCFNNDTGPERWVEVTPAETANTLQQAERCNEREWEGERGESAQGRKSKAREAEIVRSWCLCYIVGLHKQALVGNRVTISHSSLEFYEKHTCRGRASPCWPSRHAPLRRKRRQETLTPVFKEAHSRARGHAKRTFQVGVKWMAAQEVKTKDFSFTQNEVDWRKEQNK